MEKPSPTAAADPEHSLSLLNRSDGTRLSCAGRTSVSAFTLIEWRSFFRRRAVLDRICGCAPKNVTAGGKMVLNRSSRDSPKPNSSVRTPNLKLSGPTSIFCNDRLSQQSSAALPSPVSFCFSLFPVKGFDVSQSFPKFKPHLQTDKNHAPFSPDLLAAIWVRLLNDLH